MKHILRLSAFLAVLFAFAAQPRAVLAQYFKMELETPNTAIKAGDTFNVKMSINTQGVEAINGDALIVFDPAKISIESAQSSNFFTFAFSTLVSGSTNKYLASS